jgi:acyl dehydratase
MTDKAIDEKPVADVTAGLPIGSTTTSMGRTIGEGEFTLLNTLSWSLSELHTNKVLMLKSAFGERLLAGPILTAIVGGLHATSDGFRLVKSDYGISFVAGLSMDAKYRAPVLPGDTLWVDTTLASARASASRPGLGILVFHDVARNQRDEVVLEMDRPLLFRRVAPVEA